MFNITEKAKLNSLLGEDTGEGKLLIRWILNWKERIKK